MRWGYLLTGFGPNGFIKNNLDLVLIKKSALGLDRNFKRLKLDLNRGSLN
jgi:hypothetical protein